MKFQPRHAALGTGALALALATLAACGTGDNGTGGSSGSGSGSGSSSSGSGSANLADAEFGGITCAAGSLAGAGSSAQAPALTQWIKEYQTKCGSATIAYNGNGSGPGVTAFTGEQADWAGSDYPLSATASAGGGQSQQQLADQRCGAGNKAVSVGTVPGIIAVMYNLPGVDQEVRLSAATLAKIFNGKIADWRDPRIARENPGVAFPNLPIQSFHRGDASGTSFNFSNYLNKVAPNDFPQPANKTFPGPGGQGVTGSNAVAQGVQSTPGGIGYAEVAYATIANLKTAAVGNAAGQFVPLTTADAAQFISQAKVDTADGNLRFDFDYSVAEPDAYPAVLVTYEIACASGNDPGKLPLLKGFLADMASGTAQAELPRLGYVSLSAEQQGQVAAAFARLK